MLIGDIVRSNADRYPDRVAVVYGPTRWTWRELNDAVNRLCHGLRAAGLEKGDRIAVLAENSHEYARVLFAASKAGLITVCLNHRFAPQQLTGMLNVTRARALVVEGKFRNLVGEIREEVPGLEWCLGMGPEDGFDQDLLSLAKDRPTDEPDVVVHEDDPYAICFSSGTTGEPKAAVIRHKNRMANGVQICLARKATRDNSILLAMAMYTVGLQQYLFAYALAGAKLVIINFTPEAYLEAVERERPDSVMINHTLYTLLRDHIAQSGRTFDLSSIRLVQSAGQALSYEQWKEVLRFFGNPMLVKGLAMTEAGVVSLGVPEDLQKWIAEEASDEEKRRFCSVGRPLMGVQARVVDENGQDVPRGEIGELVYRGENVVTEFWGQPDVTARVLKDGWLHTGDLGHFDQDGYLYLTGRKDDRIRTGGYNVYPSEIEAVLSRFEEVEEAAVYGVPDDRWGEMIVAAIILKEGAHLTHEAIKERSKGLLAGFQVPKKFYFVDEFPRNPVWNRVLKKELAKKLSTV